jgi:tRNA (cytidine/uridine-2'-O-)-methyltransferase
VNGLHVVLVEPEIHWNTGNAGRSCVAAGARLHLVEPLGFSLEQRQVRRAGVHHWAHVRPTVWPDWESLAGQLGEMGEPFLFTAREGRPLWEVSFPRRCVLVFGRESVGLPEALRSRYPDALVQVPLRRRPGISLNLSTAVGIALYEVQRQRR